MKRISSAGAILLAPAISLLPACGLPPGAGTLGALALVGVLAGGGGGSGGPSVNINGPTNFFNDESIDIYFQSSGLDSSTLSYSLAYPLPEGLLFDPLAGRITSEERRVQFGEFRNTVTATDGGGGSASKTFDLTISPVPTGYWFAVGSDDATTSLFSISRTGRVIEKIFSIVPDSYGGSLRSLAICKGNLELRSDEFEGILECNPYADEENFEQELFEQELLIEITDSYENMSLSRSFKRNGVEIDVVISPTAEFRNWNQCCYGPFQWIKAPAFYPDFDFDGRYADFRRNVLFEVSSNVPQMVRATCRSTGISEKGWGYNDYRSPDFPSHLIYELDYSNEACVDEDEPFETEGLLTFFKSRDRINLGGEVFATFGDVASFRFTVIDQNWRGFDSLAHRLCDSDGSPTELIGDDSEAYEWCGSELSSENGSITEFSSFRFIEDSGSLKIQ